MKEAMPGKDLQLTIDLDLQVVAELAMEGRKGAVVALDPRNGEVLAMVSRPAFDPNKFAGRIRSDGLEGDRRQSRQSAAEPRHSGAARAGLHLQAASWRWRRWKRGAIDDKFSVQLPRRRIVLRALFQVLA